LSVVRLKSRRKRKNAQVRAPTSWLTPGGYSTPGPKASSRTSSTCDLT
jgi:hypothetical protein